MPKSAVDTSRILADLEMLVLELPKNELPQLLGALESIRARVWARFVTPDPTRQAELVDAAELGRRTGMSAQAVRDRARRGVIPVVHDGRLMRFDPAEVIAALRDRTTHPVRAEKLNNGVRRVHQVSAA